MILLKIRRQYEVSKSRGALMVCLEHEFFSLYKAKESNVRQQIAANSQRRAGSREQRRESREQTTEIR
jgi:hypothetical protein